jgi:DNA-binding XRE family transcriptional regulator
MISVEDLHNAAVELRANNAAVTNLPLIKRTISALQDVVDRAERIGAAHLVFNEDGTVEIEREYRPDPVLEFSAEGLDLEAGERLSTALKKYRIKNNLTVDDVSEGLPISADTYKRLENGADLQLAEDILTALANLIGVSLDEVKSLYQRDLDYPVMYVGISSPSYRY